MKLILIVVAVMILTGCAVSRPSYRVRIIEIPERCSEERFKKDMGECDLRALNRPGQAFGELLCILFCPPAMEGKISSQFRKHEDLSYGQCMAAKGYKAGE